MALTSAPAIEKEKIRESASPRPSPCAASARGRCRSSSSLLSVAIAAADDDGAAAGSRSCLKTPPEREKERMFRKGERRAEGVNINGHSTGEPGQTPGLHTIFLGSECS